MRRILEPALLRGLAGKLTREQLNEFQELLNRQNEDLYLDQDAADDFFISLDNDFHRLLYHDSGYDRIWEAMHNVTSHMDRVRYLDSAFAGEILPRCRKSTSRSLATCGTACRWMWT